MGKYFGTDGIRGLANIELTAGLAFKIGQATALIFKNYKNPLIFVGKDTRISSDMLEDAFCSGVMSMGGNITKLGFIPTPAVAYLYAKHGACAGVVISASHNSYEHNGIKIFGENGYKLSDELEAQLEYFIDQDLSLKTHADIGKNITLEMDPIQEYTDFIKSTCENDFSQLKIALDLANGAASKAAKVLFEKLGTNVSIINDKPNGLNINENCGSTHIKTLSDMVVKGEYDVGIAFDGDADRCLVVDDLGNLFDGDRIMAVLATNLAQKGRLKGDAFVATVLSNMGLDAYAKSKNISIIKANVGDRFVLEKMIDGGYILGGEQSGHVINLEYGKTGDGLLTAVKFLETIVTMDKKVSQIAEIIKPYPQIMINVDVKNDIKHKICDIDIVKNAVSIAEKKLGNGRILVRASGTEALVRVMVEGENSDLVSTIANEIAEIIKKL